MDTNNCNPQMSTAGWLTNGAKVYFTIPIALDQIDFAYEIALQFTNTLLSKGFLLTEPGLEAGEEKQEIGWIARRVSKDDTPIIDLYSTNQRMTFPWIKLYLNNAEETVAFESATGLLFNHIPLYEGDSHIERGANPAKDSKYIIPVKRTTVAIKARNPKYNPEEPELSKRKPQYLFRRFEDVSQNATFTPPVSAGTSDFKPAGMNTHKTSETPQKGDIRDFSFKGFTTKKDSNGKPYYSFETVQGQFGFYAFSRDAFRAVGIADEVSEDWKTIGRKIKFEHTISCMYTLPDGKQEGYWLLHTPKKEADSEIAF